MSSKINYFAT